MMQDNRLWVLISRFLAGEASPAEADELHRLIAESPEKQYLLDLLHNYFNQFSVENAVSKTGDPGLDIKFMRVLEGAESTPAHPAPAQPSPAQPAQAHSAPAHPSPTQSAPEAPIRWMSPRRRWILSGAAAALLAVSWGLLNMLHPSDRHESASIQENKGGGEVLAAPGARTRLDLPDGTHVWLNSNSKLKYARDFNTLSREVELDGEAYFDVARDVQRPFIVHTSGIDVKVLGTSFAVKCYAQDETIEATLLKGSIEVSRQDKLNSPRVILKPNEKLVFNRHAIPVPANTVKHAVTAPLPDIAVNSIPKNIPDSEKVETAWIYNRLVFDGDNFKAVAEKMERWYNVHITFKDDRLYGYRFGGAFANESIEDALNALQLTTPFTYKINGNNVELSGK